jgi:predicted dinucleotide-utilizing enzyme
MREIKSLPDNPFKIGWINETTRHREAVIEADSEQAVKDFFDDAVRRNMESVRGFELVSVESQ